jgi:hypothetical protein
MRGRRAARQARRQAVGQARDGAAFRHGAGHGESAAFAGAFITCVLFFLELRSSGDQDAKGR